MSVLEPIVDTWDGENRRAYLKEGVSDFYPIEDLYHEYRYARRTNEDLRKYNPFMKAEGNVPKGAGAFTPRYVVLLDGFKIVPYNDTVQINQLGDIITDNPDVDASIYDVSELSVPKPIFIKPSEAETIQLNSESIVFSSFMNAVWVDATSTHSDIGTPSEPNGNRERPVNTVSLAVEIAKSRGFDTIKFIGNYTLGSGEDVTDFTLIGQNATRTLLTLEDEAIISNVEIKECTVTGVLDGGATLRECVVYDMNYFSGFIYNSILTDSTITLGNGTSAIFLQCYSGSAGTSSPTIDFGGSGQSLGMRNYNGNINLINKDGDDVCSIDMNAGRVIVDESCTNGDIFIRGVCRVVDNSGGSSVVTDGKALTDDNYLNISESVWSAENRTVDMTYISDKIDGSNELLLDVKEDTSSLIEVQAGNWEMKYDDVDGEQQPVMIFYGENGDEIYRFALYDADGNPSFEAFSRQRV